MILLQAAAQHAAHAGHHQSPFVRWILHLGPLGIFVVSFFDGWVIPLPIPGSTDLLLMMFIVRHGNPWIFTPLAIAGSMIGGLLTWRFGKAGGDRVLHTFVPKPLLDRVTHWVRHRAFLSILVATMLPPPMPMTPFALAAGALGVERRQYLIAYGMGRTVRYGVIAWLGVKYGRSILHAWRHYLSGYEGRIAWTLAALTIAGLGWGFYKYQKMRTTALAGPVNGHVGKAEKFSAAAARTPS